MVALEEEEPRSHGDCRAPRGTIRNEVDVADAQQHRGEGEDEERGATMILRCADCKDLEESGRACTHTSAGSSARHGSGDPEQFQCEVEMHTKLGTNPGGDHARV